MMISPGHIFAGIMGGALILAQFTTPPWPSSSHIRYSDYQASQVYSGCVERSLVVYPSNQIPAVKWYKFDHYNCAALKIAITNMLRDAYWVDKSKETGGTYVGYFSIETNETDFPRLDMMRAIEVAGLPTNFWWATPWKGLSSSSNGWLMMTNLLALMTQTRDEIGVTLKRSSQGSTNTVDWSTPGSPATWADAKAWTETNSTTNVVGRPPGTLENYSGGRMAYVAFASRTYSFLIASNICTNFTSRRDIYIPLRSLNYVTDATNIIDDSFGDFLTTNWAQSIRYSRPAESLSSFTNLIGCPATFPFPTWCDEPQVVGQPKYRGYDLDSARSKVLFDWTAAASGFQYR